MHSLALNLKAFVTWCLLIGQGILNYGGPARTGKRHCSELVFLILFLSVLMGPNIYPKLLGKFGGAGTLVPTTGFANLGPASAIEYQKEGQVVLGSDARSLTIPGNCDPVWNTWCWDSSTGSFR